MSFLNYLLKLKNNMIKSYSKINLILKVYPRTNSETKHRIKSLFVLNKNLYDEITIVPSKSNKITYYSDNKKILINNCLIKKAINYLKNNFSISKNYSINVKKNINLMSGLGGGSSNAAEVIKYILKDNKISISKLNLNDIALNLGSDIPFFIVGKSSAIVTNYGDVIEPTKIKKINYKLIETKIEISTKKVFDKLDSDKNYHSQVNFNKCLDSLLKNNFDNHYIYNDLEQYIFKVSRKMNNQFNGVSRKSKIVCGSGGSILLLGNYDK